MSQWKYLPCEKILPFWLKFGNNIFKRLADFSISWKLYVFDFNPDAWHVRSKLWWKEKKLSNKIRVRMIEPLKIKKLLELQKNSLSEDKKLISLLSTEFNNFVCNFRNFLIKFRKFFYYLFLYFSSLRRIRIYLRNF